MQDGTRLRVLNAILQEQALKRYICTNLYSDVTSTNANDEI